LRKVQQEKVSHINLEMRLYGPMGKLTEGKLVSFPRKLEASLLSLMTVVVFHVYCVTAIINTKSIEFGNYFIETLKTVTIWLISSEKQVTLQSQKTATKTKNKLTREQLFCSSPNNRR
jgi:hypothetical protein